MARCSTCGQPMSIPDEGYMAQDRYCYLERGASYARQQAALMEQPAALTEDAALKTAMCREEPT